MVAIATVATAFLASSLASSLTSLLRDSFCFLSILKRGSGGSSPYDELTSPPGCGGSGQGAQLVTWSKGRLRQARAGHRHGSS